MILQPTAIYAEPPPPSLLPNVFGLFEIGEVAQEFLGSLSVMALAPNAVRTSSFSGLLKLSAIAPSEIKKPAWAGGVIDYVLSPQSLTAKATSGPGVSV